MEHARLCTFWQKLILDIGCEDHEFAACVSCDTFSSFGLPCCASQNLSNSQCCDQNKMHILIKCQSQLKCVGCLC